MDKIYYTNKGAFFMIKRDVNVFPLGESGQFGSVCLGIEASTGTALLLWEAGGDWNVFEDDQRRNPDWVEEWMPDALNGSVADLVEFSPELEDDLEWYLDWAKDAQEILKVKKAYQDALEGSCVEVRGGVYLQSTASIMEEDWYKDDENEWVADMRYPLYLHVTGNTPYLEPISDLADLIEELGSDS
jgi:hypothetical protein